MSCSSVPDLDNEYHIRKEKSLTMIHFSDIKLFSARRSLNKRFVILCTALFLLSANSSLEANVKSNLYSILPPVAVCKNINVQLGPAGSVTINGSDIDGGSYDPDGTIISLIVSPNTFTCSNIGSNNVTLTVTDNTGMISTCNAIVNVQDKTTPVMVCKNITVFLDQSGSATINPADVNNGSTDNCPGTLLLFLSRTSFSCSDLGAAVPVILTGTDASGNTASCTSNVTVLDTVSPTVNAKTFTLVLDTAGTGTLLPSDIDNGSFDNCGSVTLSVLPNTFKCSDHGTRSVTLTAVDSYGNSSSENVNITIIPSLEIKSMSLDNCDLATPYALYTADIIGGDSTYSYFWDGLEDFVKPFLIVLPVPPYLVFSNTSTLPTPFFNNTMPDGTFHIRLVVTDGKGCSDTSEMAIDKTGPVFNNVTILYSEACEGSTNIYTVNYDTTSVYSWTVENGTILTADPDTNAIEVQWNTGIPQGVVNATISKPNLLGDPCISNMVDTVTLNPMPVPALNAPVLTACSNSEYTYTLTSSYLSHYWNITGGYITSGGSSGDNFVKVRWGNGPSGRVTVYVENNFTCSGSVFADVSIDNLNGSVTSLTNISCNGGSDGKVTVEATSGSGQPPYEYSLDGGAFISGGTFTGIALGNHSVRIRDANFCIKDFPFIITQPPVALSGTTSVTNVACFGGATGAVNLTVAGGTPPYTFLWSNGAVTEDLTNVVAGVYSVTITDANSCNIIVSGTVIQPPELIPTPGNNGPVCVNTTLNLFGSPEGMTNYSWIGPDGFTSLLQNPVVSTNATLAMNGIYTLTVIDGTGCTGSASTNVIVSNLGTISLTSGAGTDNQTICTNTPIADITYSTTGATGATVTGLPSGVTGGWSSDVVTISGTPTESGIFNYTVTLTGGCGAISAIGSLIIDAFPVNVSVAADANPICEGTSVTFTATPVNGGSLPVYQWQVNSNNVGANSSTYSYIPVNNDVVTVILTSDMACAIGNPATSAPLTMTVSAAPTVVITDPEPVCSPATVDLIAAEVTAGSTSGLIFTYWIDAAATTAYTTPSTATTGVYYIKGTDASGCYDIKPVTVTVNPVPAVTSTQTDILCGGTLTGAIDITVSGGTAPFTYAWTGTGVIPTDEDQINLAAGTYSVIITDVNNCTAASSPIIITELPTLSGTIISQINVSVFGGNDGSVTVDGSGGTPPYQFSLDGGIFQPAGTFNMLTAGSHTVTVQDINLCEFPVSVTISQPLPPLTGTIVSQNNVLCFSDSSGSVTITGLGGAEPYEYTLDGINYQTSGTFSLLPAGSYTVTIRDALLFTFDVLVTITEPTAALSVTATQVNVLCAGGNTGSATATGAGGIEPYNFSWNTTPVQTGPTATGLSAGTYTITLTDANNCTAILDVTISEPAVLTVSITQVNVLCNGGTSGSATAVVTGGTEPYNYSWNTSPVQTTATATGLASGSYTVTVTDANGCKATQTVQITEPAVLTLSATTEDALCPDTKEGSITLEISGGTPPYYIIWSDVNTPDETRTDLLPGTYNAVVSDANACAASTSADVGFTGTFNCLTIPNIITPNNDGHNDEWQIRNIDIYPDAEILVFSRWGKLVYRTKNISENPWNGRYRGNGDLMPTDSYHYILYLNDGSEPRSGVISIIR